MGTITYVGAGTTVTAVNASVQSVAHANTADDDLVLLFASIRNSGTGTVDIPTGWSNLINFGNARIMGRLWQTGDVIPPVSFSGGVAGADTIVMSATFRDVSAEVLSTLTNSATQLNGSAQNIAWPGLTVPYDRHLILHAFWKQDDASATTTPGTTSLNANALNVVGGDDAYQGWFRVIQTTAVNMSGGTLTMTGGGSAISRAMLLALKPAATFTAVEQDAYPPRVLLSLTDLTIGDAVELYRVVGGVRTPVRAGSSEAVSDPSFLRVDAELPFGVPVSYRAVVNGVEYRTDNVTYTLTGGKVALSDAVTGLSAEVVILAWPEKSYEPRTSTFRAGNRNIVVAGPMAGFTGSLDLFIETTSSLENLRNLLAVATEGVVQIRQPGGYDGIDSYVAVTAAPERRFSQDGSDERRVVTLQVVEVEGWAPVLEATGYTYDDLEDAYIGLTYADLAGDYATYLALAQAELP